MTNSLENFNIGSTQRVSKAHLVKNHTLSESTKNFIEAYIKTKDLQIKDKVSQYFDNRDNPSYPKPDIGFCPLGKCRTYAGWKKLFNARVAVALFYYWPNRDLEDLEVKTLTCWLDKRQFDRGRGGRTSMKTGRLIRRMFPFLTDPEVESLVDLLKLRFGPKTFYTEVGETREDFKKGFTGPFTQSRNFYTTYAEKNIKNSCMRYHFKNLPAHPSEAYASGDFKILVARNSVDGLVGGRSVLHEKSKTHAPVYATCQDSLNKCKEWLKDNGYTLASSSSWKGSKMLKIATEFRTYILPYLDIDSLSAVSREDLDYFVLSSSYVDHLPEGEGRKQVCRVYNTVGYSYD